MYTTSFASTVVLGQMPKQLSMAKYMPNSSLCARDTSHSTGGDAQARNVTKIFDKNHMENTASRHEVMKRFISIEKWT